MLYAFVAKLWGIFWDLGKRSVSEPCYQGWEVDAQYLGTVISYQSAQKYCRILATHTSILVPQHWLFLNKALDFKSSLFPQHRAKQCALPNLDLLCHYISKTYNHMTHRGCKALVFCVKFAQFVSLEQP